MIGNGMNGQCPTEAGSALFRPSEQAKSGETGKGGAEPSHTAPPDANSRLLRAPAVMP